MVLVSDPDVDADRLLRLVQESEMKRDAVVRNILRMQERTVGRGLGGASHRKADEPQNKTLSLYTLLLPQAIGGTPQCLIEAERGTPEWVEARAIEESLNVWSRVGELRGRLEAGFFDHFHGWAMALIQMAPNANMTLSRAERERLAYPMGPHAKTRTGGTAYVADSVVGEYAAPELPMWVPLPLDRCGWDMMARVEGEEAFWWHMSTHDLSDLEELARAGKDGWRYQAVMAMQEDQRARALGKARHARGDSDETLEERGETSLYNIWVPNGRIPGRKAPKHHRGIWVTLAILHGSNPRGRDSRALVVRDPEWCFAPPGHDGPYNRSAMYRSSLSSQPFSMVLANKDQIELAQAVASKMVEDLRKQKTRYAVDAKVKGDVDKMFDSPSGTIASIPGLSNGSGMIQRVDVYGLDAQTLAAHEWVEGTVDRSIALDSAQQGVAQSNATATGSGLAAASLEQRMRHMLGSFREWIARGMHKAAWMIGHSARVVVRPTLEGREEMIFREQAALVEQSPEVQSGSVEIPERVLRRAAANTARTRQGVVQGGAFAQDERMDFMSLSLSIRPFSLRASDDVGMRQESLELFQLRQQIGAAMVQLPHIDWMEDARRIGVLYGRPGWERAFDAEKASMMAQIQIEGAGPNPEVQTQGGVNVSKSGPQARIVNRTAPEPGQQAVRALGAKGGQR